MDSRNKLERQIAGHPVRVSDINANSLIDNFDDYYEEDLGYALNNADDMMSDYEIKIEALKLAINIAKLQDNVTPKIIFDIAKNLAEFIKNRKVG